MSIAPSVRRRPRNEPTSRSSRSRGLDASYGPVQILFGLDLDIYEGEIVALLGTNGAGKSTLFKCITEPARAAPPAR